jgi:hypothetical protein
MRKQLEADETVGKGLVHAFLIGSLFGLQLSQPLEDFFVFFVNANCAIGVSLDNECFL